MSTYLLAEECQAVILDHVRSICISLFIHFILFYLDITIKYLSLPIAVPAVT